MHEHELSIDQGLVERLIGGQFPQWADLPIIPIIGPLLPVATPVPLGMGEPASGYPWRWSVYPWLDGVNPTTEDLTEPLVRDIAACLNAIHALDVTGGPVNQRGFGFGWPRSSCCGQRLERVLRMARSCTVIDNLAKDCLHGRLKVTREALVWKLDGLSEYDIRRPLTVTGTNLLGLVKHLAICEAWYFGEVFGRPFPEPLPHWQDADGSDLWVAQHETREQIVSFYQRAWHHADATINELPIDAPGHVPWWPRPDWELLNIVVHVLQDTTRHAGQADILREQLDGRTGLRAEYEEQIDTAARETHRAKIEQAARAAAAGCSS